MSAPVLPSSTGTAEAVRTVTLWFEQQIENAQQDQISGFAIGTAAGTLCGERAHARHCAMYEAQQMFLKEIGSADVAQGQSDRAATPQEVQEACAQVAYRVAERADIEHGETVNDVALSPTGKEQVLTNIDTRKRVAIGIAHSIRALIPPAASPPAPLQAGETAMDDIVATIANEWGSHLCYAKCSRSVPPVQRCRCFDIANALAAEYDIRPKASSIPSTNSGDAA